ncbi:hypothetical protein C6502_08750 [Candidatus Poribacteria bacterium]|nr:MAG: hypothetical protein C6502_08750 [Candidatus Poribacteria bacterium]
MKCNQVQEKLLHSIDKELSPQIRAHLLGCKACERKYRILQETEKSLEDFGDAVRDGSISMETPPFPPVRRRSFWIEIHDSLRTPVPVWVPSAIGVVGLLLFAVAIFSPLTPSVEWGPRKGSENTGSIASPLSAEAMLEFLIVPEPTDTGQLAASIEAVETFLKIHPDDFAMHAKLVELYQSRLKLGELSAAERNTMTEKLSRERQRFSELLDKFYEGSAE